MAKEKASADFESLVPRENYKEWFTDRLAKGYISSLPSRFKKAPLKEKREVFQEAYNTLTLYSVLIYQYYPASKEFQQEINSMPELRENFGLVKNWLDKHDGKVIAEQFVNAMESAVLGAQLEGS